MLPRSTGRSALLILAIAAALTAAGCAREKPKPRLAYEERPVELLYSTGAFKLDQRRWGEAVAYFQEVERQHPYSEWSRRAILMTAYAHYQGNQYAEAIKDSERFIQLYPGNPSVVYAYYLKAICYFEQIVDVGRDQASTEQALASLREVIQRYPQSEYASDARLKVDMVNDQLAGKEMAIGRYYLRQGQTIAAIGRFRTVVDRYQTTTHTPEALYRLVESYLTVGLVQEATANGAVLGANFPGDAWYGDAYALLTNRGLQPAVEPKTPGAKRSYLDRLLNRGTALPPPGERAPTSTFEPTAAPPADPFRPVGETPKKKSLIGRLFRR